MTFFNRIGPEAVVYTEWLRSARTVCRSVEYTA
jgi:hypothetical protein